MLGDRYCLFPDKRDPRPSWPDRWPNADKRGVYLMLGDDDAVLYVGKASADSYLGARLAAYFRYGEDRRCKFIYEDWCPRYVVTIAVPDDSSFEAPALEEFLIRELRPPRNTLGNTRSKE